VKQVAVDAKQVSVSTDFRIVFRSRQILTILGLSLILRLIFHFIVLPNTPSGFGPDEGTYAALASYVSRSLPVQEFPEYGAGLYNSARSLLLPSATLIRVGFEELNSIRAISSLYGLASSLVLALSYIAYQRIRHEEFFLISRSKDPKFFTLLILFSFFPSNFIWSTIGLRESASQFWILASFYTLIKLFGFACQRRAIFASLTALALMFSFGARPETALVFSLTALLTSLGFLRTSRNFFGVGSILLGILLGQVFTTTPTVATKETLVAYAMSTPTSKQSATPTPADSKQSSTPTPADSKQSSTPTPADSKQSSTPTPADSEQSSTPTPADSEQSSTPTPADSEQSSTPTPVASLTSVPNDAMSKKCVSPDQIIETQGQFFKCKLRKSHEVLQREGLKTLEEQLLTTKILAYKRNVNTLGAQSALPLSTCIESSRDILYLLQCNVSELPYRLFAFLFRPFVFFDTGSTYLTLAAIENLGWVALIALSIILVFRRNQSKSDRILNSALSSYALVFASAAALYEGNVGTAFRHKSSILWPLIFILMVATHLRSSQLKKF
jgi:hypothetical protein